MQRLIPLALLVIAAPATGQPADRRFDVRGFDAVELASSDTIRIVPSSAFSVTAKGDPRAVASMTIEMRGSTLHIGRTPGRHDDRGALVRVAMPALRMMSLSGAGAIDADGVGGDLVTVRLSGSGDVRLPDLQAKQVRLALSGSGSITASGRADRVNIDLGGSGSVSAAASNVASIRAGGSGSVRVSDHPNCAVTKSGTARVTCG